MYSLEDMERRGFTYISVGRAETAASPMSNVAERASNTEAA